MPASYVERIIPGQPQWNADIASHRHRYQFAMTYVRGSRVLDAGCGVGYGSRMLAEAGACEVVAVDVSEAALAAAQRLFSHSSVRFLVDNCETLRSVHGPFGVIVAFESLEHFHDVKGFLDRVCSLLSADGVFICSTPNSLVFPPASDGRPANPYHVREYTPEGFSALLMDHFQDVSLRGQHLTAACSMAHQLRPLWFNPFMRLGWLLQKLRGHKVQWNLLPVDCTESDYVMREDNLDRAEVLVGVCRRPSRT